MGKLGGVEVELCLFPPEIKTKNKIRSKWPKCFSFPNNFPRLYTSASGGGGTPPAPTSNATQGLLAAQTLNKTFGLQSFDALGS